MKSKISIIIKIMFTPRYETTPNLRITQTKLMSHEGSSTSNQQGYVLLEATSHEHLHFVHVDAQHVKRLAIHDTLPRDLLDNLPHLVLPYCQFSFFLEKTSNL